MVNGTQQGSLGPEVLAAASAALAATSAALVADTAFYQSSAKVRTLQAAGETALAFPQLSCPDSFQTSWVIFCSKQPAGFILYKL